MVVRTYPQGPDHSLCFLRQRILYRFDNRRHIIRRVIVDKKNFIGRAGQRLGYAVQTDSKAFMVIISMIIITPIQNYRKHIFLILSYIELFIINKILIQSQSGHKNPK